MTSHQRTVLLLGSGEFEPWVAEAERAALARATSGDGSVAILPTASSTEGDEVFNRWGRMGMDHYAALGIESRIIPVRDRSDAFDHTNVDDVASASMIFFSGGRPSHLAATVRETPFWGAVLDAVDRGAAFGGCSAGAMVAGAEPPEHPSRLNIWTSGLGVVPGVVFGVHWDAIPRPLHPLRNLATRTAPRETSFLGIDERTAILGDGRHWEVFGESAVHVGRGRDRRSFGAKASFEIEDPS